jgi:uncharacterized protein
MFNFEYDEYKSKSNKQKHGIDFEEAKNLWKNPNALIIPAKIMETESRFAIISKIESKCYVGIFTKRVQIIRIISVRRCRKNEEKLYENDNY